jgi:cyclase
MIAITTARVSWMGMIVVCVATLPTTLSSAMRGAPAFALTVTTLTPRVSVLSGGPDGNILVLDGENEALIVDGQALDKLESVLAAVASVTEAPVRAVINTHYHPDHVGANGAYAAQGATVISHAACREQMTRASEVAALGWAIEAAPEAAWPTLTYDVRLDLHIEGEVVELHHLPAAHTGGDTVVRLRNADVIHAGDVFELAEYPFLDIWHGGSLPGLVAAVDRLLELAGENTRIVPGHGPVVGRAELVAYRDMLATLFERVSGAIDAQQHAEDFFAGGPTDDFDARWGSPRGAARLATYAFVGMAPEDLVRSRDKADAGR